MCGVASTRGCASNGWAASAGSTAYPTGCPQRPSTSAARASSSRRSRASTCNTASSDTLSAFPVRSPGSRHTQTPASVAASTVTRSSPTPYCWISPNRPRAITSALIVALNGHTTSTPSTWVANSPDGHPEIRHPGSSGASSVHGRPTLNCSRPNTTSAMCTDLP